MLTLLRFIYRQPITCANAVTLTCHEHAKLLTNYKAVYQLLMCKGKGSPILKLTNVGGLS